MSISKSNTSVYYRPIVQADRSRPSNAHPLAGGPLWFNRIERLSRTGEGEFLGPEDIPGETLNTLTRERAPIYGLDWSQPRLMTILNVTPDSFSDGGQHDSLAAAQQHTRDAIAAGADIIDVGGESTRPGADVVDETQEVQRVVPVINAIRSRFPDIPISIDTRKASVAKAAHSAGAGLFNDVSALSFDPGSAGLAAKLQMPVCLMHSIGDPTTMQSDPHYENVLLDVYDALAESIDSAIAAGISRDQIMIDPGIGFGKTQTHNLDLIRGLSLFHGLGCPILLGVSRKRFIGTIGEAPTAQTRAPGSIAVALEGIRQGVQMVRVHDTAETKQALRLWQALL